MCSDGTGVLRAGMTNSVVLQKAVQMAAEKRGDGTLSRSTTRSVHVRLDETTWRILTDLSRGGSHSHTVRLAIRLLASLRPIQESLARIESRLPGPHTESPVDPAFGPTSNRMARATLARLPTFLEDESDDAG